MSQVQSANSNVDINAARAELRARINIALPYLQAFIKERKPALSGVVHAPFTRVANGIAEDFSNGGWEGEWKPREDRF